MAYRPPLVDPRMFGMLPDFYPSLVSIEIFTETRSPSGQVNQTWAIADGYRNIPARVSPTTSVAKAEMRTQMQTVVSDRFTIALQGPYPDITVGSRVKRMSDDSIYNILDVIVDGNDASTYLDVERIS